MARFTAVGESMKKKGKFNNLSKNHQFIQISRGFTLIELMVVMTIIALLISIAVPHYFNSVQHAKEATLKQSLGVMRVAIDKFYGDNGRYPESIAELVTKKYIRAMPVDPITESSETWIMQPPSLDIGGAVYDIKSGATGTAKDGTSYAEW